MNHITRINPSNGQRVWLDSNGHWVSERSQAGEFDDATVRRRLTRLPHAEAIDTKKKPEEPA